jgi:hypothetical protein
MGHHSLSGKHSNLYFRAIFDEKNLNQKFHQKQKHQTLIFSHLCLCFQLSNVRRVRRLLFLAGHLYLRVEMGGQAHSHLEQALLQRRLIDEAMCLTNR